MRSLHRLIRLALPTVTLILACNVDGPATTSAPTSSSESHGDGDGEPTGDGDGDGDGMWGDGDGDPGDELRSSAPHDDDPQLVPGESGLLAAANHALTLDLYHAVRNGQAASLGFTISPYSIQAAFALLYGGTAEPARTQMAQTLHFDLIGERQHVANNWLAAQLGRRNIPADDDADPVELLTANSVWALDSLAPGVSETYLDLLSIHYDTGLRLADFDAQPDAAREHINSWASEQTNGLIPELFGPGSITDQTTIVLVNALYIRGPWDEPFRAVEPWDFKLLDNQVSWVDMLHNGLMEAADYGMGGDYEAVALPLRGGQLDLVVIMPDDFVAFEDSLDLTKLDAVLASLAPEQLDLRLPRFELASSFALADTLAQLGMPAPFTNVTSFDAIHPDIDVVDTVVHKTVLEIDEDGLEAAAVTGIGGDGDGDGDPEPHMPIVVIIDKPFLVAIRDRPTNTLLFFGRVLNPSL